MTQACRAFSLGRALSAPRRRRETSTIMTLKTKRMTRTAKWPKTTGRRLSENQTKMNRFD